MRVSPGSKGSTFLFMSDMASPLLMDAETPLPAPVHAEGGEGSVSLEGCIVDQNTATEKENYQTNPDDECYKQPGAERIVAHRPTENLPADAMASSDVPDHFDGAMIDSLLNRANIVQDMKGPQAPFEAIKYAVRLWKSGESFSLP